MGRAGEGQYQLRCRRTSPRARLVGTRLLQRVCGSEGWAVQPDHNFPRFNPSTPNKSECQSIGGSFVRRLPRGATAGNSLTGRVPLCLLMLIREQAGNLKNRSTHLIRRHKQNLLVLHHESHPPPQTVRTMTMETNKIVHQIGINIKQNQIKGIARTIRMRSSTIIDK